MPTKKKAAAVAEAPKNEIDELFAGIDGGAAPPILHDASGNGAAVPPSDAGTPDGELTQGAQDTLAQMAAQNGETTEAAGLGDLQIPGLTSEPTAPGTAGRKARAKAKPKGKGRKAADPEKAAAAKAAAKEKAKAKQEAAKAKEKERKEKLNAQKKERAAQRASKATPELLKGEPAAVQKLFADHYARAAKVGINGKELKLDADGRPVGVSMRRPKCDRGDFAAGWYILLLGMRAEGRAAPKTAAVG